jgi:hypothetical protein
MQMENYLLAGNTGRHGQLDWKSRREIFGQRNRRNVLASGWAVGYRLWGLRSEFGGQTGPGHLAHRPMLTAPGFVGLHTGRGNHAHMDS